MNRDTFRSSWGGKPVFECGICLRSTRQTNQGNESLCPQCDAWSMEENGISDGNYRNDPKGLSRVEAMIKSLKEKAAKNGGDRARLGLS